MIDQSVEPAYLSTRIAGWSAFVLCAFSPVFLLVPYLSLHAVALAAGLAVLVTAKREGRTFGDLLRAILPGLPVFAFFGLALTSAVWAEHPTHALRWAVTDTFYPAFFSLALLGMGDRRRWLKATVVALPIICLLAFGWLLLSYGSIRPTTLAMWNRVGSVSDTFPALCLLCIPFLVLSFTGRGGWKPHRAAAGCGFAVAVAVVVLSGSRGALLMLLAALFLSSILLGKGNTGRLILSAKIVAGTTAIFLICLSLAPQLTVFERSESLLGRNPFAGELPTAKFERGKPPPVADFERSLMYREGVTMVTENPVLGAGYMGLMPRMEEVYGRATGSHSIVITAWGELGIAGLLAALWIVWAGLRGIWKGKREPLILATGVAFIVAVGHAQIRSQLDNAMLYVVLAVLLVASTRKT